MSKLTESQVQTKNRHLDGSHDAVVGDLDGKGYLHLGRHLLSCESRGREANLVLLRQQNFQHVAYDQEHCHHDGEVVDAGLAYDEASNGDPQ